MNQPNASSRPLPEQQDLPQVLLDAMPLCVICWNRALEIVYCNEETVRLFEVSGKGEVISRFHALSPEFQPCGLPSAALLREQLEIAFQEGFFHGEWLHQTLSGYPLPTELTLVRTRYNGSDVVAGYVRDIRLWRETLAAIQEADERTQIMLDATPLCANFWDQNGNNLDCNEAAVKLFDLPGKQEYLDRFYELSPEFQPCGRPSAELAQEYIVRAFETGYCQFEWMHQKLGGEPVPAEITLVRVGRESGDIVVGYTRDLRELKETMAKMREADERTQLMLDATPLCCNLWDREFHNLACNQEAVNLFELSSKEEYLERFFELSPEVQPCGRPSSEMALEYIQAAFRDGSCRFEWMHRKLEGEPIPAEITLVRVPYQGDYIVAGYTRDLRELKATLSRMEQTQRELRLAKEKAEESAQAKSDFLANMSHELRTPMNAIIGMTEIAKSSQDMERMQYCLSKIDGAAEHLLSIINDILDISKIEAGKFTLSPSEFVFQEMIQRAVGVISLRVGEKNQNLTVQISRLVPHTLLADRQRLVQVMTNLLSNAVKFTPEGGEINLRVDCLQRQEGHCVLQFQVADTGIGISPWQMEKLFRPFEQADTSISRRFGGTGLGLAISRSIVESMGGRIWAESELGEGARFFFTVRAEVGRAAHDVEAANAQVDWSAVRLLAFSLSPEDREAVLQVAAHLGIGFHTAGDAEEFARWVQENGRCDILFFDCAALGARSAPLLEQARRNNPDLHLIGIASAPEQSQVERSEFHGAVHAFLPKPVFRSAVVDTLNSCFALVDASAVASPQEREAGMFSHVRLLLAEDIEINQEILIALLSHTGIEIDCAANGQEAVERFCTAPERYHMIFMDIHMPGMDGYQATRAIRALSLPRAGEIPIVAMTANVYREDVDRCLQAGMNDHVGKPLDIEEVIKKIRQYT